MIPLYTTKKTHVADSTQVLKGGHTISCERSITNTRYFVSYFGVSNTFRVMRGHSSDVNWPTLAAKSSEAEGECYSALNSARSSLDELPEFPRKSFMRTDDDGDCGTPLSTCSADDFIYTPRAEVPPSTPDAVKPGCDFPQHLAKFSSQMCAEALNRHLRGDESVKSPRDPKPLPNALQSISTRTVSS